MNIKNLLTAGLTLAAVTILSAQSPNKLQYGFNFGGNAKTVDVDAAGNAYIAGTFSDDVTFGSTTLSSNGDVDVYVIKVNPTGNILWAVSYGSTDVDDVADLEIDNAGNVYLGGYFYDAVDFDPGAGTKVLKASQDPDPNTTDGYILKLDKDGKFIYVGQIGGLYDDAVRGVGVEPSGIVYLTGSFSDEADVDPTSGQLALTSAGADAFFVRLNANGSFAWAKQVGNTDTYTNGFGVAVDFTGTPIFTGNFQGDIDIDPGTGTLNITAIGSTDTNYLLKLNASNGNMIWGGGFGGDGVSNVISSIYADGQNNIYLTGSFYGTGDFDLGTGQTILTANGEADIFVAKYHPSGNLLWAQNFGGAFDDFGASVFSVANDVYVTGGYQDGIDFETYSTVAAGDFDLFLLKLTSAGAVDWAWTNGGILFEAGRGISGNDNGNIVTVGEFGSDLDLDPTCKFLVLDPATLPSYVLNISPNASDCIVIVTQPTDVAVCAGEEASLQVLATAGGSLSYTWMAQNDDGDFDDLFNVAGFISGADTPFLTITTGADGKGENSYMVRVSAPGEDDVYSNVVFVSTGPHVPVVQDIVNCGPGAITINAFGGDDGQYKWFTVPTGGSPIAGETNHSYTTPFLNTTTTYYVSIGDGTCESARAAVVVNITKCEQAPGLKWAKGWGGAGVQDDLASIIVAKDGNLIVTGNFEQTVDFDPGVGVTSFTATGVDGYIMKITPNGDLVWAKQITGAGTANMGRVVEDAAGNLYIGGSYTGVNDFDPGAGTVTITATPANIGEGFISKYDKDGNLIWIKTLGGNNTQRGDGISGFEVDASGLYIIGAFWSTFIYDGTSTGVTSFGSNDVFILKADLNGNLVWFKRIGNSFANGNVYVESASAIALNGNDVFVYANTGPGTTDLDPGAGTFNMTTTNGDAYVVKLDVNGNFQLAFNYSGTDGSYGSDIAIDKNGNIITSGTWSGTVDFDPGSGVFEITSTGSFNAPNAFYCKHTPTGALVWAKAFQVQVLNNVYGGTLTLADNGDIFTSGSYQGSIDFDPGPLKFIMTGSSLFLNSYVVKMNSDGEFNWAIQLKRIKNVVSSAAGGTMVRDANGDIFMTGSLQGSVDFDPSDCAYEVLANGGIDFYIQRLSFGAANICFDTDPVDVNTCSGSEAKYVAVAVGAPGITYQWQKKNTATNVFENINDGAMYSGTKNFELTVNTKDVSGAGVYRSIASAPNAASKTSAEAKLELSGAAPNAPTTIGASSCSNNVSLTLKALGGTDGFYRWYASPTATGDLGVTGDTFDTGPISAKVSYYVSITDGSCESTRTIVTAIPNAGGTAPDVVAATRCGAGTLTLTASGGTDGQYRWYTTQSGGSPIAQQVNSTFTTTSLTVTTTYYVAIQITGCETPRAAVVATIQNCATNQPPAIASSNSNTGIGGSITVNLNDLISDPDNNLDPASLKIITQPTSGAVATIDGEGNLLIDYSATSFVGQDEIIIEVCDFGGACVQQTLTINVDGDLNIYNAVSPNGDGKNDILYISNITMESTKNNHVKIFNRWGDLVFDAENYDNTTKVFSGQSNSGKDLSSGTYFYRIEFKDGRKSETGYLSLKR